MSKKVMIITYNDTGGCFVKNYHEGEINVEHKEKFVKNENGDIVCSYPKHDNIKMKKMKVADVTPDELNSIISALTSWRIRLLRAEKGTDSCNRREKCKGCEEFGWICDYENKVHGYFTCRLMNKKCADSRAVDTIAPIDFSTSDITMYKD